MLAFAFGWRKYQAQSGWDARKKSVKCINNLKKMCIFGWFLPRIPRDGDFVSFGLLPFLFWRCAAAVVSSKASMDRSFV
jgi:hypothetical protein